MSWRKCLKNVPRGSALVETMRDHPYASAAVAAVAALAASALVNRDLAVKAERDNPARGRFVEIGGVLVTTSSAAPAAARPLHGNGSMIQDFVSSGLVDLRRGRIASLSSTGPDTGKPRVRATRYGLPAAQADLIHRALGKLGVTRAVVLGHSWGASVAVALGFRHPAVGQGAGPCVRILLPERARRCCRPSGPAVPLVGDIVRHTMAPLMGRAVWPAAMRKCSTPPRCPKSSRTASRRR